MVVELDEKEKNPEEKGSRDFAAPKDDAAPTGKSTDKKDLEVSVDTVQGVSLLRTLVSKNKFHDDFDILGPDLKLKPVEEAGKKADSKVAAKNDASQAQRDELLAKSKSKDSELALAALAALALLDLSARLAQTQANRDARTPDAPEGDADKPKTEDKNKAKSKAPAERGTENNNPIKEAPPQFDQDLARQMQAAYPELLNPSSLQDLQRRFDAMSKDPIWERDLNKDARTLKNLELLSKYTEKLRDTYEPGTPEFEQRERILKNVEKQREELQRQMEDLFQKRATSIEKTFNGWLAEHGGGKVTVQLGSHELDFKELLPTRASQTTGSNRTNVERSMLMAANGAGSTMLHEFLHQKQAEDVLQNLLNKHGYSASNEKISREFKESTGSELKPDLLEHVRKTTEGKEWTEADRKRAESFTLAFNNYSHVESQAEGLAKRMLETLKCLEELKANPVSGASDILRRLSAEKPASIFRSESYGFGLQEQLFSGGDPMQRGALGSDQLAEKRMIRMGIKAESVPKEIRDLGKLYRETHDERGKLIAGKENQWDEKKAAEILNSFLEKQKDSIQKHGREAVSAYLNNTLEEWSYQGESILNRINTGNEISKNPGAYFEKLSKESEFKFRAEGKSETQKFVVLENGATLQTPKGLVEIPPGALMTIAPDGSPKFLSKEQLLKNGWSAADEKSAALKEEIKQDLSKQDQNDRVNRRLDKLAEEAKSADRLRSERVLTAGLEFAEALRKASSNLQLSNPSQVAQLLRASLEEIETLGADKRWSIKDKESFAKLVDAYSKGDRDALRRVHSVLNVNLPSLEATHPGSAGVPPASSAELESRSSESPATESTNLSELARKGLDPAKRAEGVKALVEQGPIRRTLKEAGLPADRAALLEKDLFSEKAETRENARREIAKHFDATNRGGIRGFAREARGRMGALVVVAGAILPWMLAESSQHSGGSSTPATFSGSR